MIHLNYHTAAAHHLAGFSLTVDLTQTDPLAELLVVINLQTEHKAKHFSQPKIWYEI